MSADRDLAVRPLADGSAVLLTDARNSAPAVAGDPGSGQRFDSNRPALPPTARFLGGKSSAKRGRSRAGGAPCACPCAPAAALGQLQTGAGISAFSYTEDKGAPGFGTSHEPDAILRSGALPDVGARDCSISAGHRSRRPKR